MVVSITSGHKGFQQNVLDEHKEQMLAFQGKLYPIDSGSITDM